MADHDKKNAVPELDPTAKALVKEMDSIVGDAVPEQAKGFLGVFVGLLAQKASNWVGSAFRNTTLKVASKYTDDAQKANQYSAVGDMAGRSLITTMLPNVIPAWKLITERRKTSAQVKDDFSLLLRSEGAKSGLLGGVESKLEVVRYQSRLNEQANSMKTKGFIKKLFTETLVDAAVNAPSMLISEVEQYTKYQSLIDLKAQRNGYLDPRSKEGKQLAEIEKERKVRGADASALRDQAAQKSIKFLSDKMPFIPDENGFNDTQNSTYNQFAALIGSGGDFTEDKGRGRANFLGFMRDAVGYSYKAFLAPKVSQWFGKKAGPTPEKLLSHISAAKMIKALEVPFKGDASPNRVSLVGAATHNCLVGDYVYDIFVKHRADMKFQPLSAVNQEKLREACDVIAAAMQDANRRLHPQALAYLVDSHQGIIEYKDGKVSGVKGGEALEKTIQSLISDKGLTTKPAIKATEYYQSEKSGEGLVHFTRAELIATWENLSKEEQLVFSTNLPDEVLADISGSKEFARELRMQHNDSWQPMFMAIKDLSPKVMQQAGISTQMQKDLARLKEQIRRDPNNALHDNQAAVMNITAEICVRMDAEQPGFLSRTIAAIAPQHAHDHEEEVPHEAGTHFQDKVGVREKITVLPESHKKDHIKDIVKEGPKDKLHHRLGQHHAAGEVGRHG